MDTREARRLMRMLCESKILRDITAQFVRLLMHRMCRMLVGRGRGKSSGNRKLMKVSSRLH